MRSCLCKLLVVGIPELGTGVSWLIILLALGCLFLFSWNYRRLLKRQKAYSVHLSILLEEEINTNLKKSNFIRTAYHEVRSQFRGMKMMIAVLDRMKEVEGHANLVKLVRDIKSGSANIELVMSNIMEWSKFEAGVMEQALYEPVAASVFFKSLISIARYDAEEKNVRMSCVISDEVDEYVVIDRLKVTQIVTNLLNNATKFSYPGGAIFLYIERVGRCWRISVRDEGKGIAREKMQTIFHPFVREVGRDNAEGIGLGLSICERLVSVLKGEMGVVSQPGEGTTFTVDLPVLDILQQECNETGKTIRYPQVYVN